MSMKCDRCGEVFNPEPPDEMGRHKPNAVILVDKNVHDAWDYWSCDCYDEPFLCPSCMAKLNDWLKGEQERQAKWICDHESNSIECDKCRAEYKLSPYERVSDFDYCPNCGSRMEGIKE